MADWEWGHTTKILVDDRYAIPGVVEAALAAGWTAVSWLGARSDNWTEVDP